MSTVVVAVSPDTSFDEMVRTLIRRGVRAVPVVAAGGSVVGVVSQADLSRTAEHGDPGRVQDPGWSRHDVSAGRPTTAADVMTSPVVTVRSKASVAEAARVMRTRGVGWLAVVDDHGGRGRLVGVLGRPDILSVFLRDDADLREEILHGVFGAFLGVDPATMDVEVHDGVATLAGELAVRSDVALAVALVGRLEGVVAVVDRLTHRSIDSRRDAVATPLF